MAKRSYWQHGYKKKRRKRGEPQFSTIEEMEAHTADKKRKAMKEIWSKEEPEAVKAEADDVVKRVNRLEEELEEWKGEEGPP